LFTGTKGSHHIQCSKLLLPMWQHGIYSGSGRLQQSHIYPGIHHLIVLCFFQFY
jgi:hypothetical protein